MGKAMQSPVVGQIAQVVKPAVAAGTRAVEKDDEGTKPNKNAGSTTGPTAKLADQDTSDWRHIQTSDGKHYKIHPADLAEAQRRDAQLKILDQP